MADDKRKKKRGRKTKLNLRSCFPSFANQTPNSSSSNYHYYHSNSNNKSNDRDLRVGGKFITVSGCNKNDFLTDVEIVNKDDGHVNNDRDSSSHRTRISRLFKAVFFNSFMAKKKIDRSTSKSSATSNTSESASSLSTNHDNAIRVRESTDLDSSLITSCSRTTSSSNLTFSCCSSSNSNSQWSSEQKPTSSRIELVDLKPNPNPIPISSINSTSRSDSLPKPNSSRTLLSSNSPPLPKPNPNHSQNKIKSTGTNRNNVLWCLLLLLSLVVLVVYGRIYSILCTSTWFYFVPCRKMKRVNSVSDKSVKVVDTDSEQYKKRVIMAGLLDRTRNPLR